ncbi:hypothetical protein PIROE2DRAFT_5227 [Piromyces sp. E2]|nr:hypothetical protein PIROE2DRAFT_5227 [Piromyces sp. E2]|eukprot:OUM67365.1 hypothetical protein PIROE2DRAFT_5227 [Piromyces sp. E2]
MKRSFMQRSPKDSISCTVWVSPLSNKLNEKKRKKKKSNIKFDSVITTTLSHESLMFSFNKFLTSDPEYETNSRMVLVRKVARPSINGT